MLNDSVKGIVNRGLLPLLLLSAMLFGDETPRFKGPLPDLVEIPLINTASFEEAVARQIKGYQNALLSLGKTAQSNPKELGTAYGLLGQVYQAYEWMPSARRCYLNAVHLDSKAFRWHYLLAMAEADMGNPEEAERQFRLAAEINPDYAATYIKLGEIRLQYHDHQGAEAEFKKAFALVPNSPAAWVGMGRTYQLRKDYGEALTAYNQAIKQVPAAVKINYFIAMTYRDMGKADESRAYMKRAGKVGVSPKDPLVADVERLRKGERVYLQKGQAAFGAGDYRAAAELFQKAVKSKPDSVPARINLGSSLGVLGDIKGAIQSFNSALELDANNATAHYNLGRLYTTGRQWEAAGKHLDKAASLRPDDLEIQFSRAVVLAETNRLEESIEIYQAIESKLPGNLNVALATVKVLIKAGRHDDALAAIDHYRGIFPDDLSFIYYHSQILVSHPQKDKRDGKRAMDLALQLLEKEKIPPYMEGVAMAHAELGNCELAAKWQAKVVAMIRASESVQGLDYAQRQLTRYEKGGDCSIPVQ